MAQRPQASYIGMMTDASRPSPRGKRTLVRIALAVIAAIVLTGLLALALAHTGALADEGNQMRLVHLVLIFVLVASGLAVRSMAQLGQAMKHAGVWLLIFAALVLAHGFQGEAKALWERLIASLDPAGGRATDTGVAFQPTHGGHFIIDADVDGTTVRFLVDTGASRVVLSPRDAERLGFDLDTLAFTQVFNTANGTVHGAPVRLGRIAVGPIAVDDVRASVNGADMDTSLLGLTFLNRTGGYAVENGVLTLKP